MAEKTSEELCFDRLPGFPQCEWLRQVAPRLWAREGALALWIGGSLARGNADCYSDTDLRLAVTPETFAAWSHLDIATLFEGRCAGWLTFPTGAQAFLLHLALEDGTLYDLLIQSADAPIHDDAVIVLGCRDAAIGARLAAVVPQPAREDPPADPDTIRQAITDYWIGTLKHRKALHRSLSLLCLTGIQRERAMLFRLWLVEATGRDSGAGGAGTIFSLTQRMRAVEAARGSAALGILGADVSSREAICRHIERLREEVSAVGHVLAERMGFPYPHALEQAARRTWAEFLQQDAARIVGLEQSGHQ